MNTQASKILANAVLLAAQLHEDSFDKEAYEAEVARLDSEQKRKDGPLFPIYVDAKKYYGLTYQDAAERACSMTQGANDLEQPVYLLLVLGWNDALAWAEAVSESKTPIVF